MKRSYIKKMSKGKAKEMREERKLETKLLSFGGGCEWPYGCTELACDKHQIVERSQGGSPTNPFNCPLLCLYHHNTQHRLTEAKRIEDEPFLLYIGKKRIKQGFKPADYGMGGSNLQEDTMTKTYEQQVVRCQMIKILWDTTVS